MVYIVMEYCSGGDLSAEIKRAIQKKTYMDEEVIWKVFYQLMDALNYCHTR